MTDFTDLRDGGRRLAPLLEPLLTQSPLVLAVLPNGVPVAVGIREVIDVEVRGLPPSLLALVLHDCLGTHQTEASPCTCRLKTALVVAHSRDAWRIILSRPRSIREPGGNR